MKKQQGFTLIEVMIVVVVVAILAAVAIPSYQNSIQKTRRADAKESLTRIAAQQERYFFSNNKYGTFVELGLSSGVTLDSQDGHYTLSLACTGTPCNAYTLTATAKGAQAKDTRCATLTLTHTGLKGATGTGSDATAYCWR